MFYVMFQGRNLIVSNYIICKRFQDEFEWSQEMNPSRKDL